MGIRTPRKPYGTILVAVVGLVFAFGAAASDGAGPVDDLRARGEAAYEAGRYAEAAQSFAALDSRSDLDGATLYRLYFARNATGDAAAAETLRRALAALESEFAAAPDVETGFYLHAAYGNVARLSAQAEIAAAVAAGVERGTIAEPATPIGAFRLGRLLESLERSDDAARRYERALAEGVDTLPAAYVSHAARALLLRASAAGDAKAEARYAALAFEDGSGTVEDYMRIGVMHARAGDYTAAQRAFNRALVLDPARGNRPRYLGRLVYGAAALAPLPDTDADGNPWEGMDATVLESAMKALAEVVAEVKREVAEADAPLPQERREALQARLDEVRPRFVAAALEYALQGHSIRETAFFGGFAQLIFNDLEWKVPRRIPTDEERERRRERIRQRREAASDG